MKQNIGFMQRRSQTGPIEERWSYLKNYRYDAKGISCPYADSHEEDVLLHDHPSLTYPGFRFELAYVLSGVAIHYTEMEECRVGRGDLILVDYGIKHGYRPAQGEPFTVLNSTFDYSDIDSTPSERKNFYEIAKHYSIITEWNKEISHEVIILHDTDGAILRRMEEAAEEHKEKRPGYQGIMKCKILEIILLALRAHFCKEKPTEYSPEVRRIIDYMEYGYMSNIPLSDFAKELGMSLGGLSKLFIKETGVPYTKYVSQRKISESCKYLSSSDEKIELIAEYVGFSDSKRFRKKFKELVGMTPREFKGLSRVNGKK